MSKKNICFFSGDITRSGGTERVATMIVNELEKYEKINISILSMWEESKGTHFTIDDSINRYCLYQKVSKGIWRYFGYVRRLRSFVKKNDIDVIVDVDGILDMYTVPATLGLKTKIISWEHFGFYSNPYVGYRKITRRLAAKKADAIVVLTEKDKQNYISNLNINGSIHVIGNPIHLNKQVDYKKESKTILSVGRLSYDKGFDMLVKVGKKVLADYPDWKWIIVGEGEEREALTGKIEEYNLQSRIQLVGRLKNLDNIYSESAILVCTSRYEGFGMMLVEAMNFGVPCVSFKCPEGPEEIIDDGVNGVLIDCFDLEKMAEEIERLIDGANIREEYSKKCAFSLERYSVNKIVDKWKELFEGL